MDREWRKVQGNPNYSVSNDGLVKSDKRNKIKDQRLGTTGYSIVDLYDGEGTRRTCRVHRLVAESFIDNPECKEEINHLDGIKTNNNVENLEWATKSENMLHAYATGLNPHHASYGMLGKKNPNAGRHGKPVRVIETGEEFDSIIECANSLGIRDRGICDVLNGHQNTHGGYHFERV